MLSCKRAILPTSGGKLLSLGSEYLMYSQSRSRSIAETKWPHILCSEGQNVRDRESCTPKTARSKPFTWVYRRASFGRVTNSLIFWITDPLPGAQARSARVCARPCHFFLAKAFQVRIHLATPIRNMDPPGSPCSGGCHWPCGAQIRRGHARRPVTCIHLTASKAKER